MTYPLRNSEKRLLAFIQRGLSNKEIADQLSLTEGYVKFAIIRMKKRLGVSDRQQMINLKQGA